MSESNKEKEITFDPAQMVVDKPYLFALGDNDVAAIKRDNNTIDFYLVKLENSYKPCPHCVRPVYWWERDRARFELHGGQAK